MPMSPLKSLGPSLARGAVPPEDEEDPLAPMGGLRQAALADADTDPPSDGSDNEDADDDDVDGAGFAAAVDPEGIDLLAKKLRNMSARQAYQSQLSEMINRPRNRTGQINIPLLQFAAGLLKPTQSGTLGEALGNSAPEALKGLQQQRLMDEEQDDKTDALKLKQMEGLANDEREDEQNSLKLALAKYSRKGRTAKTADGVLAEQPDGTWKVIGELPPHAPRAATYHAMGAGPHGEAGLYRMDGNAPPVRVGDLTPNQATTPQSYEKKADQLKADRDGAYYDEILSRGRNAQTMNRAVETLSTILDATPLQGAAAPTIGAILSVAQTLGLDPKEFNLPSASPGEVARAVAARLVTDKAGGKLGAGISNADVSFLVQQVPGIANTEAANKALSAILKRLNDREVEVMRFAYNYENQNGGSLAGLGQAIDKEFGGKSIFDEKGAGEFTREYVQSLTAGSSGKSLKTTIQAGQRAAAESRGAAVKIEQDFRRGKLTREEADKKLNGLGY